MSTGELNEVLRTTFTISNRSDLWKAANCKPDHFHFSTGLLPGFVQFPSSLPTGFGTLFASTLSQETILYGVKQAVKLIANLHTLDYGGLLVALSAFWHRKNKNRFSRCRPVLVSSGFLTRQALLQSSILYRINGTAAFQTCPTNHFYIRRIFITLYYPQC